jgi:hypothetical protein
LKNGAVLCGNPFPHVLEVDSKEGQINSQEFSQFKTTVHDHLSTILEEGPMKKAMGAWLLLFGFVTTLSGQRADSFSKAVKDFVVIDAPMIALTHVRVLDGTGSPALEDQSLLIADGRVQSLGAAATTSIPPGVQVKNLAGYTVIPGLVGMHDHLFYPTAAGHYNDLAFSAPRLGLPLLSAGCLRAILGPAPDPAHPLLAVPSADQREAGTVLSVDEGVAQSAGVHQPGIPRAGDDRSSLGSTTIGGTTRALAM